MVEDEFPKSAFGLLPLPILAPAHKRIFCQKTGRASRPNCLKYRQEIVATHETFSDFLRLYR